MWGGGVCFGVFLLRLCYAKARPKPTGEFIGGALPAKRRGQVLLSRLRKRRHQTPPSPTRLTWPQAKSSRHMIASTLEAIDPCVDATRNEGEARLRLLSSALRSGWAGRSPAPRDELVEELLQICEGPVEQVRICLDAATTQSFSPATADEMKPADRQLAVALVGSDRLAVLHWPQELLPEPRIVVEVKQSLVEVRRSSCNTKLVISRRGGRGGRGRGS